MNRFDGHVKQLLEDKYSVQSLIGKGGMANVYRAIQLGLDRDVAVKVIHPNLIHDHEAVKRFRLEAKSAARLNHPNIITIYDVDEREDVVFICLEFLDGMDLSDLISNRQRLRVDELLDIMIPVSSALAEIHRKSLIHRDIKSSNIFITHLGRPVLMDFGIAALKESSSGITMPGTVIGTPEYMSPEQANGEKLGPESDIYSLGIVMYQCLSGSVPFSGDSPISTIIKISQGNVPELDRHGLDVPEWLHNIVLKCLAKNPQDRFRKAQDLMDSLSQRKIVTSEDDTVTQVIALNYDKDIEKLKGEINHADSIDDKLKVLESSPKTLKEIFNIQDEIQVLLDAKSEKEAFSKHVDEHESFFESARKVIINEIFAEITEEHDGLMQKVILPYNNPIVEMSAPLFLHYVVKYNGHLETLRANVDDLKKTLRASISAIYILEKLYKVLPHLAFSENEEQKVSKKLIGSYDELSHELINLFKGESWGRTERKVIFYNLTGLIESKGLLFPQKEELHKLLAELHNKYLYPNSKLFHIDVGGGLAPNRQTEPILEKSKNGTELDSKAADFSFDEMYSSFIRQNLLPHPNTKQFLNLSKEEIERNTPSRLLYLFFSPKRKDNALSIIVSEKASLLNDLKKSKLDLLVVPFTFEGESSRWSDFSTFESIDSEEGKRQWDEELKEHLKKIKTNKVTADEGSSSATLMQNFNIILTKLKPYVLKSLS
jgi:serine/threonine protein kinase